MIDFAFLEYLAQIMSMRPRTIMRRSEPYASPCTVVLTYHVLKSLTVSVGERLEMKVRARRRKTSSEAESRDDRAGSEMRHSALQTGQCELHSTDKTTQMS